MTVGIQNATNITVENITQMVNVSSVPELFINVNHQIYGGWFFFIILSILLVILFVSANKVKDQPLNNALYSSAVVAVLSLVARGIEVTKNGIVQGLLTDYQMWIFPVITMLLAAYIYATKDL